MLEDETYQIDYFCNFIRNILSNQAPHQSLDGFYGDERIVYFTKPFESYSSLHKLIDFVVTEAIGDEFDESDYEKLWPEGAKSLTNYKVDKLALERAFEYYEIPYYTFSDYLLDMTGHCIKFNEDDRDGYFLQLIEGGDLALLTHKVSEEVFQVIFQDRKLLFRLNYMMASVLETDKASAYKECSTVFKKEGVLKSVQIPDWVKKVVFSRDKGSCVLCFKDLSEKKDLDKKLKYSHMVSLASSGFNDVSNIQLLCGECHENK